MKPRWKYNHELELWVRYEPGKPVLWYKHKPFEFLAACAVSALIWTGILCLF
jgi:hypothetical protein